MVDRQPRNSGMKLRRETEVFGGNPSSPGPLYPPQIPHGLPRIGSGDLAHVQAQKEDALKVTTLGKWCRYASFIVNSFNI